MSPSPATKFCNFEQLTLRAFPTSAHVNMWLSTTVDRLLHNELHVITPTHTLTDSVILITLWLTYSMTDTHFNVFFRSTVCITKSNGDWQKISRSQTVPGSSDGPFGESELQNHKLLSSIYLFILILV